MQLNPRLELNVATPLTLYVGDTAYPLAYDRSTGNLHLTGIPVLTSGQSYEVSIRTTAPPPPPETREITLWTATLVAVAGRHEGVNTAGYCASNLCDPNPFGSLTTTTFSHDGVQYGVRWILSGEDIFITGEPRLSGITLYLDSASYPLTYNSGTQGYDVTGSIVLTAGQTYTASIRTTTTEPPPPPETNEITLWTATLVARAGTHEGENAVGYCDSRLCSPTIFGSLTTTTFTHAGAQYEVLQILRGQLVTITGEPRLSDITLYLDDTQYPLPYDSDVQQYRATGSIALTADQSYTVSIRTTTAPPPPETREITLWTATLAAVSGTHEGRATAGYCDDSGLCSPTLFGSLTTTTFSHAGGQYDVRWILSGKDIFITGEPRLSGITLYLDSASYPLTYNSGSQYYEATGSIALTAGQSYTASIRTTTTEPPPVLPPGTLWSATLEAGAGTLEGNPATGYCALAGANGVFQCVPQTFGTLSPDSFDYEGTTYSVNLIANDELYITSDLHEATPFSLYVGDTEYTARFTSPDADINYALTLIHRRTACRRPAEETKGCASESGIMVL